MPDSKSSAYAAELKHVTRSYGEGETLVRAIDQIDLGIETGSFTVLAGPSGSGKSTLLNQVGCLDRPDEGEVFIAGLEVASMSNKARASLRLKELGFVFQSYNLLPVLTARENAEFVLELQGVGNAERRLRVDKIFEDLGIQDLASRKPGAMSGGQQQRVAVARAMAHNPALVLADEPTANLDSTTGRSLLEMMREINQEQGVTFLISSHDPMVIEGARTLVKMRDGKIDEIVTQD
jgi:putative ABC transport system ATP-binding protein